ncbi:MAG: sigma factor [Trebonia sp.]|jgi:DNA-directed RNA polymerase specialized sigma24 family protein
MDDTDWLAARFEESRPHLRLVAYRMLGSLPEADDAVQNSWLRLSGVNASELENLTGWLTTVVARECLKAASYALRYSRQARFVRPALVDGTPGLAIVLLGRVIGALGFTFRDEAIIEIEMIDIPDRLRRDVVISRGGRLP